MNELEELRKQPHWSYSALNTYLNVCQLQYYFRYVERAEAERTSACLPFGRAFHAALTAQAWECVMGGSLTREEIVERFVEAFEVETEAAPNLIYKDGESFDTMIELASKMLDSALADWSDHYLIKGVAETFVVVVPGLSKKLIGEFDFVVHDGPDPCIVDWKTSAARWPVGKADRDLQATVFSYAYWKQHGKRPLFRFDVTTKAKTPVCESHYTVRDRQDFERFEFLAGRVEQAVNNGVFLPSETSFACAECPYAKRCRSWHCKSKVR
ncbi:MAG: PD-(D/E)XK nuclease family protein [Victivallaceae bacterium]|nr:PD-(D/E)XK nuclease family protein [Victivallaceae bacterium]